MKDTKDLDYWRDEIGVVQVDDYINKANNNGLTGVVGWYAVVDQNGICAYFGKETDALRYRLDYINRKLNP